jgi:transposase-like protein
MSGRSYEREIRVKAVRLVRDHVGDYATEWAAIKAVSSRLGMSAETLRKWLRQSDVEAGQAVGVTTESAPDPGAEAQERRAGAHNRDFERGHGFLRAGVRPAMPLICQFIASRRQEYGVTPICRALGVLGVQIAPRTYRAHLARPPSKRALWDAAITEVLAGYYEPDEQGRRPPECLYGATKMWAHRNREGIEVARCTVERLMRANEWRRIWSTLSSMPRRPVCCMWPTSPTCHWPAAGSATPRSSSTPTPG